jgi:hypothetical protein
VTDDNRTIGASDISRAPHPSSFIPYPLYSVSVLSTAAVVGCNGLATAEENGHPSRRSVAVERGLKALAALQQKSGAWQLDRVGDSSAATSLAVMAFMAAGHVPGEGPYGIHLRKRIDVLKRVSSSGYFHSPKGHQFLVSDRDLDPLRNRDDFRKLCQEHGVHSHVVARKPDRYPVAARKPPKGSQF